MKKYCVAILILLFPFLLQAQVITTIAGTGSSSYSGEGGPATVAGVPNPAGGTFDKYGNYYFANGLANRINKITPSGIITTVAGNGLGGFLGDSGPATLARLNYPSVVRLDTAGNMYIADVNNHRIRKVNAVTGTITTIAGTGTPTYDFDGVPATSASLWGIQDICLDKFGNLYIADGFNYRIRKVTPAGIISTFAGNGTPGYSGESTVAISSMIWLVGGLCSDTTGNIYFANNSGSLRVMKINTSGIMTTVAGNGLGTYIGDGIPATDAQISPLGIFVDSANNLFIADKANNRVYKVNGTSGVLYNIAGNGSFADGGDGGLATAASMYAPVGVALDPCGNLYIPTIGNISVPGSGRRIRKVTFNPTSISTISIAVSPNDTVCQGTPVTYTATITGGSTPGYQWYKNGTAIPGATNSIYTYTPTETGDAIKCVYTGVDICSFIGNPSSNIINMIMVPLSLPIISITAPSAAVIGTVVSVNAFVTGAGSSYSIKWYNNSVLFSTTTAPITTYLKGSGVDIISAKVSSTDAVGCYDTATSSIHAITVIPNGVDEIGSTSFSASLYPNPVYSVLMVSATDIVNSITVSNLMGQILINKDCNSKTAQIDVANLPAGVYMVRINNYFVVKFVKQ